MGEIPTQLGAIRRSSGAIIRNSGAIILTRLPALQVMLHNTGKVATSFSVVRHTLSRGNVVEVLPAIGRVPPGEKTKLLVRLLPGLLMRIKETFLLQVAHFEPVPIAIGAEGIYSRVTLNLP